MMMLSSYFVLVKRRLGLTAVFNQGEVLLQ